MIYENDIVQDAFYLIDKFNQNGKSVSNLQIQKLMYFFEAYYMNVYDVDRLYECNFNAWTFGPVSIPLYEKFRKFGSGAIILTDQERESGKNISKEKKILLDNIYIAFKDITPQRLVELTHMQDSPWHEVWIKNGEKVGYGANTYIDKIKMRDWFGANFISQ